MLGRPHCKNVRKIKWPRVWWSGVNCGRYGPRERVAGSPGTGFCAAVRLLTLKTREVTCASFNTSVREKKWTKNYLHFSLASSFFLLHFCSEAALGEPSQPHPVSYRRGRVRKNCGNRKHTATFRGGGQQKPQEKEPAGAGGATGASHQLRRTTNQTTQRGGRAAVAT